LSLPPRKQVTTDRPSTITLLSVNLQKNQERGGEAGVSVGSSESQSVGLASTGVSKFLTRLEEAIWY